MPNEWEDLVTHVKAFAFPEEGAVRVLVADGDPSARRWLRDCLAGRFWIDEVDSGQLALERFAAGVAGLIIVGRQLTDMTGGEMLAHAAYTRGAPIETFLLADASGVCAQVAEAHARVIFRLVRTMKADQLEELLLQASTRAQPTSATGGVDGETLAQVLAHTKRIAAETDSDGSARAAIAACVELAKADRGRCLYYDADREIMWAAGNDDELDASAGLSGFAVHTVASVVVPHAAREALYRRDIDDPAGSGTERLAIVPVIGLDANVHAVLSVTRSADLPPFSAGEIATLELLATSWAPYLQTLVIQADAAALEPEPNDVLLFRQEAIQNFVRRGARGDVVRVHPSWVAAAYWLVLASLIAGVAFVALARVHQYAEGPSVIRFTGRNDVVAYETGTIASIEVVPGQRVAEAAVLVRMHDTEEAGRLRGLDMEFERKLVGYLQTPADPAVRQALSQIVSQRESAQANVESRVIRAPHAGTVREVMVRNGQRVDSGTVVLSIVRSGTVEGLSVLAFLPGGERPRLHAHQSLTVTFPGYRGARIHTTVRAISTEVLGAKDAKARYLGDRVGESLPIAGTVVVVEAILDSSEFSSDGETYKLSDGMIGLAEVQLASHTVLQTLLPGLQ